MSGLPRAKDQTRPVTATQVMLFGMFETMTHRLRRGDAVDEDTCATIEGLIRRMEALRDAYEDRVALIDGGDA